MDARPVRCGRCRRADRQSDRRPDDRRGRWTPRPARPADSTRVGRWVADRDPRYGACPPRRRARLRPPRSLWSMSSSSARAGRTAWRRLITDSPSSAAAARSRWPRPPGRGRLPALGGRSPHRSVARWGPRVRASQVGHRECPRQREEPAVDDADQTGSDEDLDAAAADEDERCSSRGRTASSISSRRPWRRRSLSPPRPTPPPSRRTSPKASSRRSPCGR